MIRSTGTMTGQPDQADAVRATLPRQVRLIQAVPGCQAFDVTDTASGVFSVSSLSERFADRAGYEADQIRTRAGDWWRVTAQPSREFALIEA
ncbi:MAG: antibiotic biosynthesis monooxygenase [Roseovarius sp.]